MIRADNISFRIGQKWLLYPFSMEFATGKLHIAMGANGAGKSTLVKLLSGQWKPSEGNIFLGNKSIQACQKEELARARAVLSQNIDFAFPINVQDVVMMGRYPHFGGTPQKRDKKIAAQAASLFEIGAMMDRDYTTLSGGEKQRVQFARVLAQIWPEDERPRLLFLDEPLTYLDIRFQYGFMHQVRQLLKENNLCVIAVLHDLNLASRFADSLLLLKNGQLLASGTAGEVLTRDNIEEAYGIVPQLLENNGRIVIDF